jgi:hypothetical protein
MTKLKLICCIFSLFQLPKNKTEVHFKEFLLRLRKSLVLIDRRAYAVGNAGVFFAEYYLFIVVYNKFYRIS